MNQATIDGNALIPKSIRKDCYNRFKIIPSFEIPEICGQMEHTHVFVATHAQAQSQAQAQAQAQAQEQAQEQAKAKAEDQDQAKAQAQAQAPSQLMSDASQPLLHNP